MNIENYAGQSVLDEPRKKDTSTEKKGTKTPGDQKKAAPQKREKIAVVNGKLAVVPK